MTDVGLERTESTELIFLHTGSAEGFRESGDLDGIAERCAGAVAFDVTDRTGFDAGIAMRHADNVDLTLDAGSGVAVLHSAVIVHPCAANNGVDVIAVADGIAEAFQHHDSGAISEDCAGGFFIVGAAMPVTREHALLGVKIAPFQRQRDGDSAGEGHVAETRPDRAAGFDDGDHGGRAGRLQGHRGTAQVQFESDAGGEVVLVIAQFRLQRADLDLGNQIREEGAVGAEIGEQVSVKIGPPVDADALGMRVRRVARALHRFPRELKEDPLLRVHDLRVFGKEAEE